MSNPIITPSNAVKTFIHIQDKFPNRTMVCDRIRPQSLVKRSFKKKILSLAILTLTFYPNLSQAEICIPGSPILGCKNPTEGDDTIEGTDDRDFIDALGGNDIVSGRGGDDLIQGGTGNDRLYGEIGNDKLYGGDGTDSIYGGVGDDLLVGGKGDDYLDGGDGVDTVSYYNDFNGDLIWVDLSITGKQLINVQTGYDTLINIENLIGSPFDDQLSGNDKDNHIQANIGNDLVYGRDGDDDLRGEKGNDRLFGDNGNDYLSGGEGDDELHGGNGNDNLWGGDGIDEASYQSASNSVQVDLNNTDYQQTGQGWDKLVDIENVTGSANYGDTLIGDDNNNVLTGLGGDDVLAGNSGNDQLIGGGGVDTADYGHDIAGVTVKLENDRRLQNTGGSGLDLLVDIENISGSQFQDYLHGDEQDNVLNGRNGDDVLYGLSGNDVLIGGDGDDNLLGGDGDDELHGGNGNDVLYGLSGNDVLIGGDGHDALSGGDGDDELHGGNGNDNLWGRDGIDEASYLSASNSVQVDLNNTDYQQTGQGWDKLVDIENVTGSASFGDTLIGDDNNNVLTGLGGDDVLIGGDGEDVLVGGDGDDLLVGGNGNDVLIGGEGVDQYNFLYSETLNYDRIIDTSSNNSISTSDMDIANNAIITVQDQKHLLLDFNNNNSLLIENQFNDGSRTVEGLYEGRTGTFDLDMSFEQLVNAGDFSHYQIQNTFQTTENISNSKNLTIMGQLVNDHTLNNQGKLTLATGGSIDNTAGLINNQAGGEIAVNASTSLGGDIHNNGIIRISTEEMLTMTGNLSGAGSFVGDTMLYGVSINPGNSPGNLTFDGDTSWQNVDLTFELEQLTEGVLSADSISVMGDLTLFSAFSIDIDLFGDLSSDDLFGENFDFLTIAGQILDENGIAINDLNNWVNILTDGWDSIWTQDANGWSLALNVSDDGQGNPSTDVAEPSILGLFALSGVALLFLRRKIRCQYSS